MDPFPPHLIGNIAFGGYALLLVAGAACDIRRYIIPNGISVALVALFAVLAAIPPGDIDWIVHLAVAGAVLAVGALLFRLEKLGGGDVKLCTAAALWAGPEHLAHLLAYVAIAGGVLAVGLVLARRLIAVWRGTRPSSPADGLPRVLRVGEPVPYGAAIAMGAIAAGTKFWYLGPIL